MSFGVQPQDVASTDDMCTLSDIHNQRDPKYCPVKTHYTNQMSHQEKKRLEHEGLPSMTRRQLRDKEKEWRKQFDRDEQTRKKAHELKEREAALAKSIPPAEQAPSLMSSHVSDALGLGCKDFPITNKDFEQWLQKRGDTSFTTAAKAWLQPRSALVQKTIIPAAKSETWQDKEVSATREMCWELHPGMCRTKDAWLLPVTTHIRKNFSVVVENLRAQLPKGALVVGQYFKVLVCRRADDSLVAEHFCVLGRAIFKPVAQVLVLAREEGGILKLAHRRPASGCLLTQFSSELFSNIVRERDADLARDPGAYEVRLQILQAMFLVVPHSMNR